MSENAKWRVPDKSEVSLLNSIPRTGFAFVVKESTAYGINKFQQDWEASEKGQSNWTPIFISWRDMPDCEDPVLPGEDLTPTPREEELTATYKLRPGHLKFRRRQIQALGSERAFQQDFPLNPREPFLSSGMPYFPVDKVQERLDELAFYEAWKTQDEKYLVDNFPEILLRLKHHPRGLREALGLLEDRTVLGTPYTLSLNQDVVTYTREAEARPESGAVTVFRLPDPSRQYLLSVDGGEGLRSQSYTSDLSVIEVVDTFRREQVAEWAGVFDEEVTSMYAVMMGRMYNMGQIVVEMNNRCGGILWEKMLAWKYPRLFYRQSVTSGSRIQKEPGWLTTVGNKAEVCGKLRLDFKNDDCLVYSRSLLEEMLFFTDDRGKLAAMPGHTDDRVMAMAVNLRVIADTPALRQPMKRETPEQMRQIFREYNGFAVAGRPRVSVSRRYR
jgi:hypothetical protein